LVKPPRILKPGEWFTPAKKGMSFFCCDCGQTHTMFATTFQGQAQIAMFPDKAATKRHRRRLGVKLVKA